MIEYLGYLFLFIITVYIVKTLLYGFKWASKDTYKLLKYGELKEGYSKLWWIKIGFQEFWSTFFKTLYDLLWYGAIRSG